MVTASGEQQYMAGYNAGRATCLRTGSSEAGRHWLDVTARAKDSAYVAGYEWALWDYEDANGRQRTSAAEPLDRHRLTTAPRIRTNEWG